MYGGSVGWISRGNAEAAFEEAVFKTPVGKLVRIETSNGLHLLKVEDERYEANLLRDTTELLYVLTLFVSATESQSSPLYMLHGDDCLNKCVRLSVVPTAGIALTCA